MVRFRTRSFTRVLIRTRTNDGEETKPEEHLPVYQGVAQLSQHSKLTCYRTRPELKGSLLSSLGLNG